jgi:Flp pilus assembly protein TadB
MIAQLAVILAAVVLLAPGLLGLWRPGRRHPITVPERPATARPTSTRARRRPPDASWATTLERLARDTSTGVALAAAIDHAADRSDTPEPLRDIAHTWRTGVPLAVAVADMPGVADPDERLALEVLRVLAAHGGPTAAPLDRAAAVLRERRALAEERRAQAAQADLSAKVLSVVPVGFVTLAGATDRGLAQLLLATPLGWACLAVGGALDLIGWRWMRRIVGRS